MFRRHWSGLPKDVTFPADLGELGYFINEDDEIRSSKNPDYYFKFFLDRNMRVNHRQRFAFDHAVQKIIHQRLYDEGLRKITLPLDTRPTSKHIPVFVDSDLRKKHRVAVIFGETQKNLGVLAGRVISGNGGINKGSMVSVVKELRKQRSTASDDSPPGIVLANMGEVYWYPDEQRTLTWGQSFDINLPSLVHPGRRLVDSINLVEGHEDPESHVQYIFEELLLKNMHTQAVFDIIAIGDSCELVEHYLNEPTLWDVWKARLSSILLMDTICDVEDLSSGMKKLLATRSRCYVRSTEPVDTPLAPPSGNPALHIQSLGAPCYSSAEPDYTECVLISALKPALAYLERNALSPGAVNEPIFIETGLPIRDETGKDEEQPSEPAQEHSWDNIDEEQKPSVSAVDPRVMKAQREQDSKWKEFEETGQAPRTELAAADVSVNEKQDTTDALGESQG